MRFVNTGCITQAWPLPPLTALYLHCSHADALYIMYHNVLDTFLPIPFRKKVSFSSHVFYYTFHALFQSNFSNNHPVIVQQCVSTSSRQIEHASCIKVNSSPEP